ncbi:uncharacterized protein LOC112453845 [Temnothorax curvispinosus]|uniref:Uncharacterized protein LOC112453845 n=1 Tax=Temnothorax curvispinosus TaxID=300111 RepID=A0A6J1PMN8_9HYME|nr:uncharacterized protein LOC112453845 [Temnothorax curvispinosus]
MLQRRKTYGFYHAIFPIIILEESRFRNYFRMSPTQFENLLCLVTPFITKQMVIREPISAAERLSLTLRFLASGDSMSSMSYQYLIGLTTISNIIEETCNAIWICLQKKVLPSSLTETEWLNIAHEFEEKWNFHHCVGAIDGKHVLIQVHPTSIIKIVIVLYYLQFAMLIISLRLSILEGMVDVAMVESLKIQ